MPPVDAQALIMTLLCFIAVLELLADEEVVAACSLSSLILRDKIYKVINFMEFTVPNMLPQAFKRFFRMTPATANKLIRFLIPAERLQRRENRRSIPIWKKVYMTLAYLGTQASTHKCAQLFGVSEAAFLCATEEVMMALIDNISLFISWPEKRDYPALANEFDKFGRFFPRVIGCLDGCHLEYEVGKRLKPFFLNHKSYYSINLMAIVTYDMSFIDIFVGWPGRSHDSGVFLQSPISRHLSALMDIPNQLPPESYSILADKAFTLVREVMTPYKGKPRDLSPAQRKFNKHLNSKRHLVERAFSALKRRFRRLKYLNQRSHAKAVSVVMAACILHNVCIKESDEVQHYFGTPVHNPMNRNLGPGQPLDTAVAKRQGQLKRYILCQMIRRSLSQVQDEQ